jgi:TnpA family transposase
VFGLLRLPGFQFSPRLAGLPDQRWWRIDPTADYGPLNAVARHKVNMGLIKANWPDVLRLAGSVMAHKVKASEVMRVTPGDGRPTTLGRALGEGGACWRERSSARRRPSGRLSTLSCPRPG